ncbi:hypothetical protein FOA52_007756 [Chlamydomonas sp. UWO 241]|nr:hypothetical protein FOA52_007756 [Chlamydomonas sp. UWO 241]
MPCAARRALEDRQGGGSAYNAQARLDRFYVSPALVPRVFGCDAGESGGSYHRVVALHLTPLVPACVPGRPRVRALFWADRDLADSFRAWFGQQAAEAPTHSHAELMRWWQAFKPRLAREARRLDCDLGRRRDAVSVEVTRLRADLKRARAAVEAGRDGLAELAELYALQRRLDVAVQRYAPAPPPCVRPGERVAGGMAAAFRKPAAAWRVAALRNARGVLVTDGMGMADMMADAVAAVSRPPPASPADREAVLAAVRTHSPRVPQAVADAAGAPAITPAEVRAAAMHSKPGTAPGPDGIPMDVWRKLGEPAFVLLAAVFTAVGATGETPPGFLDGVVASIFKAKDAANASNYRPLTMLGSDYRILAKVLATRWTPLLAAVVGPEQTAILAGRRISDNICLTQMLPGLLAANSAEGVGPTGAALALLDFRKAYDTIDRGFLLAVMEAVGVGGGVLAWTRTILTRTYASAEVNGLISAPRQYAAGVRQGCPPAPALFLFLGHALACFLHNCPAVGVEVVRGCRVTCPQYADDCTPLLRSCAPADVAALVEAMAVFGRATGLVLNLGKCGVLPLGSAGAGMLAGAQVAGLRVLDAGVSLGVPVSAGLPPPEGVTVAVVLAALPTAWVEAAAGGAALTVLRPLRQFSPLPQEGERAAVVEILRLVGCQLPGIITPAGWRRGRPGLRSTAARPAPQPAAAGGGAAGEPQWVGFAHGPGVVGKLTCKLAVALQLRAVVDERLVRRAATVEVALALDHGPHGGPRASDMQVCAGLRGLEAVVPALWRVPLLNARKEPIWRLWIATDFLSPAVAADALSCLQGRTVVAVPWGGFASAERVRILLGQAEVMASVREDPASSGTVVALQVKGNFMFDPAKHPDFLGAVLGTGVVRAKVGDVLVQGESGAQILVVPDMMEHFESALVQVRTVPVEARAIGLEQLQVRAPKMEEVCSFEASLRLDALASAGFRLSRSKMADMVKAGDVRVNWRPVTKASIELKAGDVVAVAGKGRVEVKEVLMTKKERYAVTLMRYV